MILNCSKGNYFVNVKLKSNYVANMWHALSSTVT
jgi:hypothetical protein